MQSDQKISQSRLLAFFLLAFGITWGLSIFATKDLLPFAVPPFLLALSAILLHYGPAIAALIMVGRAGVKDLLGKLAIWRVGFGWYLFVFFYPLTVRLAAIGLDVWLGGNPPEFFNNTIMPGVHPVLLIPVVFIVVFFQAGLAEEIGWRGYGLPGLQQHYGALTSSLILGLIWGAWHFHPQNFASLLPLTFWYFFDIVAFTILLTWVYNNTQGSLLIAALFHTASNVSDWIVPTFPGVADVSIRSFIIQGSLGWIVAIVIVVLYGSKHLSRKIHA
jgi:membrane protease YdiL (CAAX protease family)